MIEQRERHAFWWTPEFVSVELFKVQKYPKKRKIQTFFKVPAKPKVSESFKRSCKKLWKVMEFEEL